MDIESQVQTHANQVAEGKRPSNWVPIKEEPAYARRPLRMICIGAGFSGLTLAHKIKELPGHIELTIYEKNPEVGGTWFENTYPGVRCDIPAHSYTFPFEPNPNWSQFYAPGPEIQEYITNTVRKLHLDDCVEFKSTVTEAKWDDESGKWKVTVDQNGATIQDEAEILVNACGFLNKFKLPDISGLSAFKGKLVHTARWDNSYDWAGKHVAVIGNGSSGIQCFTAMQPKVAKIVHYVRNPTWISPNFCDENTKGGRNFHYTKEEKKQFNKDPVALFAVRKKLEQSVNGFFYGMYEGHSAQVKLTEICRQLMTEQMNDVPDTKIPKHKMIPPFPPGCRRLTPGEGYIEAFKHPNAQMCWDPIEAITERGIKTAEGEERDFDMIVCATGFDTSFIPSFELVGKNGATLNERWKTNPEAFFAVQVDGMPNYFMFNGPNCPISHGSVLAQISWTCDYILRWAEKIATEDIKSIDVKTEAVRHYNVWAQEFLKRMVWSRNCRGWYKNGKISGQVTGVYPGTILHFKECLEKIGGKGGEHFNIEYNSENPFRFLGNGQSWRDQNGKGDLAYYMEAFKV